jgi:endo-alpha-1,4-polygalactosaminidase (GH114 family)
MEYKSKVLNVSAIDENDYLITVEYSGDKTFTIEYNFTTDPEVIADVEFSFNETMANELIRINKLHSAVPFLVGKIGTIITLE